MSESLHSKNLVKNNNLPKASTQQFLDIEQIKDGAVILKNGSLRSVLMVSSINFDLKSSEEQDAIIQYYQNFLNSLDFPIQIFITSRKVNLSNYIEKLEAKAREQVNELLQLQMEDYIKFISSIGNMSNIVNKNFYIVVPFAPVENTKNSLKDSFLDLFSPRKSKPIEEKKEFEIYKDQLFQRVEYIQYGLNGIGVRMVPLNTQELIELYYSLYNPSAIERLGIAPVEEMAVNTSLYG